jgi:Flp pilus assembly protein TadD
LEVATKNEAHKYIAIAHKLLGQVAVARNDLVGGEREFQAALDESQKFPVPVVEWKVYAELGRLKMQSGDSIAAREAFTQASNIVSSIATNIKEDKLRDTFLNSPAVQELQSGGVPV